MKKGKYWITRPGPEPVRFHYHTKKEWERARKRLQKKGYSYRAGTHK